MGLSRLLMTIGVLSLALFIAAVDQTIVATATVKISEEFNSLSLAPWLANAYLLSSTALQPITGKLSDIFGRTQVLLAGIVIFALGSLACALAQSMVVLLVGRAIAGAGAAAIIGLTLVIVSDIVPLRKRGPFMAVFSLVFSASSVIGPLLGGVFTDNVTWRWIFWLSEPVAGFVIVAIVLLLRLPRQRQGDSMWTKLRRIDYLGIFLLVSGMVAFLMGLTLPGTGHRWVSPEVVACLVVGVIVLAAFFVVEWRFAYDPVVPLRLFRVRNVAAMMAASFFMGACLFTPIYYIPMFYNVVENTSSTTAGIYLLPFVIGIMITSIGTGFLVMRYGKYRPYMWAGTVICTLGLGLLGLLDRDSSLAIRICFLLIAGLGVGAFIQLSLIAGQAAVPPEDMATTTAVLTFFRSTGSVFGMAVMQAIMSSNLRQTLKTVRGGFFRYNEIISSSLDNPSIIYEPIVPEELREGIINAYMHALHLVFLAMIPFSALMFLSTLPLKHIELARRLQPTVIAE
ncbi:MFS general substrate transporter [Coemansia reversa NRRL 1564]|uniref:MFS general substrate transporter n=1 Tax=Coemansia reversa (strain ATCC 12441 / NRRL 1564) TaxID=763665 RepID=A0A2G5B4U7_COERN|nr:MFS general substrate transporter [Coemansia reversa NRRL 1564]|eukprot:PIA14073.1 MFS general substrate transporter [Coemansia reversa NRRL 1564]